MARAKKDKAEETPKKRVTNKSITKASTLTHTGHKLTPKEDKFISKYVETGNIRQSVVEAGYKSKTPDQYGHRLINKDYLAEEIKFRLDSIKKSSIATAEEVMEYFAAVMRGEIKDQFGLEAPLSERTKAAQEIAKRTVDIENRLAGKADAEIKISLNWNREESEG